MLVRQGRPHVSLTSGVPELLHQHFPATPPSHGSFSGYSRGRRALSSFTSEGFDGCLIRSRARTYAS